MSDMRCLVLALAVATAIGCSGRNEDPLLPADAAPPSPDAAAAIPKLRASAACDSDDQCAGGTCLGRPGGLEATNPRFSGGFCTALGCTPDSQQGCGPDEWCIDGASVTFCVAMCGSLVSLSCERADQVCIGVGSFGGCESRDYIQCNSTLTGTASGCPAGDACVQVGFDDRTLGICQPPCDPLAVEDGCAESRGCYYISRYDAAFCILVGETPPEAVCECDRCCVEDYACVTAPGAGERTCHPYCSVAAGCPEGAGTCQPIAPGAPYGGCVL
jgi:hypothetical protein